MLSVVMPNVVLLSVAAPLFLLSKEVDDSAADAQAKTLSSPKSDSQQKKLKQTQK